MTAAMKAFRCIVFIVDAVSVLLLMLFLLSPNFTCAITIPYLSAFLFCAANAALAISSRLLAEFAVVDC
jgi:hypothetical protein